jgi:hypothetical protein
MQETSGSSEVVMLTMLPVKQIYKYLITRRLNATTPQVKSVTGERAFGKKDLLIAY